MKNIVFIGISSISKIVTDILSLCPDQNYNYAGYIDDNPDRCGEIVNGLKVLGTFSNLETIIKEYHITDAVISIPEGYMAVRKKYFKLSQKAGLTMTNVIHPKSVIASDVKIGCGVIITANVAINPSSIIGNNSIIWTGVTIDHDNVIEDNTYISPGCHTAGLVTVKDGSFIGTGSIILPKVVIGNNCLIGAGSLVTKSIPDNRVAYGSPAKIIRENK